MNQPARSSRSNASVIPGVLIALHGHGDRAASALAWGRRMAPADWDVVAPQADLDSSGDLSWFSSGPRGANNDEVNRSISIVEALVDKARHNGRRVVVAGFSQGGALALALAWKGTTADRVVSVCGFFPDVDQGPEFGAAGSTTKLLIIGTDSDEIVPAFMSTDAGSLFEAVGHDVEARVVAGTHHVDPNLAAIVSQFVDEGTKRRPFVSLGLPVDRVEFADEFTSASAVAELARGYESLGFHAAYVTDHPAPDLRWLEGGGHHALEPAATLGVVAGVTERIKLHTNVYVLPYRNPFLAAKALSSVDVLSGGRLIAGVAAGYLRPEFNALGRDFDSRGELLEEALSVMPRVWAGETVEDSGSDWAARAALSLPRTHGGPPLWIGGNSRAAMRRAVTMAQGWSPMPTPAGSGKGLKTTEIVDISDLEIRLAQAKDLTELTGRVAPLTICFVPFGLGAYLAEPSERLGALTEEIAQLFLIGVDWFPLMVPGNSRAEVLNNAAELAQALNL